MDFGQAKSRIAGSRRQPDVEQLSAGGGIQIGVDDGEEFVALTLVVTGPGEPAGQA